MGRRPCPRLRGNCLATLLDGWTSIMGSPTAVAGKGGGDPSTAAATDSRKLAFTQAFDRVAAQYAPSFIAPPGIPPVGDGHKGGAKEPGGGKFARAAARDRAMRPKPMEARARARLVPAPAAESLAVHASWLHAQTPAATAQRMSTACRVSVGAANCAGSPLDATLWCAPTRPPHHLSVESLVASISTRKEVARAPRRMPRLRVTGVQLAMVST